MLLGLSTAAIVLIVLLALLYLPQLRARAKELRERAKHRREQPFYYDPGR